jgi:hypothetical protein
LLAAAPPSESRYSQATKSGRESTGLHAEGQPLKLSVGVNGPHGAPAAGDADVAQRAAADGVGGDA